MMTKEEYKENIIRMWDSLRSRYKGENCCAGIICIDCPFNEKVCSDGTAIRNAYEAIDLVENWAKENPIKTNADKFREVFGKEVDKDSSCVAPHIRCEDCEYYDDGNGCNVRNRFWNAEYKQGGEVKNKREQKETEGGYTV